MNKWICNSFMLCLPTEMKILNTSIGSLTSFSMSFLFDLHYHTWIPFFWEGLKSNQRIADLSPWVLSYTSMHSLQARLLLYFAVFIAETILRIHDVMEKIRLVIGITYCDLFPVHVKSQITHRILFLLVKCLPKSLKNLDEPFERNFHILYLWQACVHLSS